jgi:hypothetical protein
VITEDGATAKGAELDMVDTTRALISMPTASRGRGWPPQEGAGGFESLGRSEARTAPGVRTRNLEIKYKKPNAQKM